MSYAAFTPDKVTTSSLSLLPRASSLFVIAVMAYAVSVAAPSEHIQLGAAIVGTSLVCLGLLSLISAVWTKRNNARALKAIASFVEHDVAACFVADDVGDISYRNAAAQEKFSLVPQTVEAALSTVVMNPNGLVTRLYMKAGQAGAAREDVVTQDAHLRLSCHKVTDGNAIWRL